MVVLAVVSVVVSPLVGPEPPLDVLVAEAVWVLVPVEPPAPVSLAVLVAPSVLALVLLTALATVPAVLSVAPALVEPVVPEQVVFALELAGPLADSGCAVGVDSEPHAATKNGKRTTLIDSDALYIPRAFRTDVTRLRYSRAVQLRTTSVRHGVCCTLA